MRQRSILEKIATYIAIASLIVVIIVSSYRIYNIFASGGYSLENTAKDGVTAPDQFSYSQVVAPGKSVAFIDYNCVSKNNCKGQYLLSFNRIDNQWVVNESSKVVLW